MIAARRRSPRSRRARRRRTRRRARPHVSPNLSDAAGDEERRREPRRPGSATRSPRRSAGSGRAAAAYETSGMLSYHAIGVSQHGHAEPGGRSSARAGAARRRRSGSCRLRARAPETTRSELHVHRAAGTPAPAPVEATAGPRWLAARSPPLVGLAARARAPSSALEHDQEVVAVRRGGRGGLLVDAPATTSSISAVGQRLHVEERRRRRSRFGDLLGPVLADQLLRCGCSRPSPRPPRRGRRRSSAAGAGRRRR